MFEQYFMEIFDNVSINIDPVLITLTRQLNIGGTDLSPNMLPISLLLRKKKIHGFRRTSFWNYASSEVKYTIQNRQDNQLSILRPLLGFCLKWRYKSFRIKKRGGNNVRFSVSDLEDNIFFFISNDHLNKVTWYGNFVVNV